MRQTRVDSQLHLLQHIKAIVTASPMVRIQLQDFVQTETQDVKEILEGLPPASAAAVMMRGPLRGSGGLDDYYCGLRDHDSMRTLRSRLFSGVEVTEESARACAKLMNAELAELYRGMPLQELRAELRDRGIKVTDRDVPTKVSVQQRLQESDALWVTQAKITATDVEAHALLQAKEVLGELTEEERARLRLCIALTKDANHFWALEYEKLFSLPAGYTVTELLQLTKNLRIHVPKAALADATALSDVCAKFWNVRRRNRRRIHAE